MRASLGTRIAALNFPPASYLIDRSEEGERIASVILRASARFAVLYGAPDSGKTDLVVRWVVPALASQDVERREVLYAGCDPSIPAEVSGPDGVIPLAEALRGDHIIILDEFERVFTLPRAEQDAALEQMFEEFAARGPRSIIVLMVDARHMNAVYALASYDTDATETIYELPTLTADKALARMGARAGEREVAYDADVLEVVRGEVDALGANRWSDTFDLTKLIHTHALKFGRDHGSSAFTLHDYDEIGRAPGILGEHLEHNLEVLEAQNAGDADTARAIFERMLDASVKGTSVDLAEVGRRIGTSQAEVDRVVAKLQSAGMLVLKRGGEWRVVPPQLLHVVENDLRDRVRHIDRAQRTVIEGLRDWRRHGTLLSTHRLTEVHAERRHLALDSEQLRFMLQTAILHGPDECARYWVHRTTNRDDVLTTLFRTLVHDSEDVRRRSAMFLGELQAPHVVERLLEVVLTDPSDVVRDAAIRSLDGIATPEVKTRLLSEAIMLGGKHRESAIDALRVFRDDDVADFLKMLVNDRQTPTELRQRAIRVLGTLDLPRSIDVLLDVGLNDLDEDDRKGAAAALGSVEPAALNRQILERLEAPPAVVRWVLATMVGLGLLSLTVVCVALIAASTDDTAVGMVVLGALASAFIAGRLLIRIREERLSARSPLGLIALVLFLFSAVTVAPFLSGLAHFTIKRRRQAAYLLGIAALGWIFVTLIPPVLGGIGLELASQAYMVVGVLMLIGAYLTDVLKVLLGSMILRRSSTRRARRNAIYRSVLTNPRAAALVFDAVERPSDGALRSAPALLKRFGSVMEPSLLVTKLKQEHAATLLDVTHSLGRVKTADTVRELESLWQSASASLRRRIVSVFYRYPTDASVAALRKLKPELPAADRWKGFTVPVLHSLSQWPRPVVFGVLAVLPALLVIIMSGVTTLTNPASSQLAILTRPDPFSNDAERRVKIIAFVADAYPHQSAQKLVTLYMNNSKIDSVHGAFTRALTSPVVRASLDTETSSEVARSILASLAGYEARLDSASTFPFALQTLEVAAGDAYAPIASVATQTLGEFVVASLEGRMAARDSIVSRHGQVIQALGRLEPVRAITILDTLITIQRGNRFADPRTLDSLRGELVRVSHRAALAGREGTEQQRKALRVALASVVNGEGETKAALDIIQAATTAELVKRCDADASGTCSPIEVALHDITENPGSELGYQKLVEAYTSARGRTAPANAASAIEGLKQRVGEQVWLRKTLAMLYHEDLALSDTSYFRRAYEEMVALRALPAYARIRDSLPNDFQRIEADFVEVVLSAHRPRMTDSLAQLPAVQRSKTNILNVSLFAYMAFAIAGERALAIDRLNSLEMVVETLGDDFENNWLYPGTLEFIRVNAPTPQLRVALTALCKEGRWYTKDRARAIIKQNREALARMPMRSAGRE